MPANEKAGVVMIRRAAEKGNAVAQNRLAHAYASGRGVESNLVEATKWHLLAREAGMSDAEVEDWLRLFRENKR